MSRTAPVSVVPWKAPCGEVINPGDQVIYMTVSTGHASLNRGVFVGHRNGRAVIDRHFMTTRLVDANDNPYDFNGEYEEFPYTYFRNPDKLRYGSPEYKEAQEEFVRTIEKPRAEGIAKRREGYTNKQFPAVRRTTLQNNAVYPANAALADFKL